MNDRFLFPMDDDSDTSAATSSKKTKKPKRKTTRKATSSAKTGSKEQGRSNNTDASSAVSATGPDSKPKPHVTTSSDPQRNATKRTRKTIKKPSGPELFADLHEPPPADEATKTIEPSPTERVAVDPKTADADHDGPTTDAPVSESPAITLAKETSAKEASADVATPVQDSMSQDTAEEAVLEESTFEPAKQRASTEHASSGSDVPNAETTDDAIANRLDTGAGHGSGVVIRNQLIRASAGTGKTYQLTSRYLKLILLDVAPETILATTFTRKAAGEILDRVVSWLSLAAVDATELKKLAGAVELPHLTHDDCLAKLTTLTRQMHRLQIHTIDAFFMQMAKSFSLELGMTPGWQVLEEGGAESNSMRGNAIASVLRQESLEDLLTLIHQITPKGVAKRSLEHTLVGSVNNAYRLFLQSAPEAWDRLEVPAPLAVDELDDVRHALASYPDKRKSILAAIHADVDRIIEEDWAGFFHGKTLTQNINEGKPKYGNAKIPDDLVAIYQQFLRHLRSMTLMAARAQTLGTHAFLGKYHAEYRALKESQRLYGFDEVTELLASYTTSGDFSQLAFRMDHGVDHLLLDEFQDTSTTQWRALAKMAERCAGKRSRSSRSSADADRASDSTPRSFFCVGDVKQAIYGWRGGSSEIFDVLDQRLPNLTNSVLQESRRSSPVVMDVVNRVFEFLPTWDEKRLGRARRAALQWDFPKHTTFHSQMPGYFALEVAEEEKNLTRDAQEAAVFRTAAERVATLSRQAPTRTIGILCRRNSKVGQMMNELQRLGIPASEEGGNYLTDAAAVELILSLLQLTDHPGDSRAAYHLATSPWKDSLEIDVDVCPEYNWEEDDPRRTAPDRPRPAAGIDPAALGKLVRKVRRQLLHDGYGDTVQRWAEQLRTFCNRREARRLTQLIERAYEYQSRIESPTQLGYQTQRRPSARPSEFVRYIRETKFADPSNSLIRVMTVHQAKGLEFDVVLLPDLLGPFVEGHETFLFRRPGIEADIDLVCRYMGKDSGRSFLPKSFMPLFDNYEDRTARESLCVLYVALTRAAHALHVFLPSQMQKLRSTKGHPGYLIKDAFLPGVALEAGKTMFELGDARWFDDGTADGLGDGAIQGQTESAMIGKDGPGGDDAESEVPQMPAPRLARSRGTRRHLETVAPSQIGLQRFARVRDRLVRQPNSTRDRGTVLHQWLAQVTWLDDASFPTDEKLRQLAAPFADTLDFDRLLVEFRQMLEAEELRDVLDRSRFQTDVLAQLPSGTQAVACEVRNEQRVAGRDGDQIVSGTIDRLVLLRDATGKILGAEIIDYKSEQAGDGDGEALEKRRDRYEMQIAAYRRAIRSSLRIENVTTRLVFLP